MMAARSKFLVGTALVVAALSPATVGAADPLAGLRGTHRILLVSTPSANDPELERQRAAFRAMGRGATDRDLVLVEAVGATAEADQLRSDFKLDSGVFEVVLIGKDGGEKLRSKRVFGPEQLYPTIDAMPMRREELRRKP